MPAAQPPALSLAAIEHALSRQRLDAYARPEDADEVDRVARYLWDMALAMSLQPMLHVFEVTLRNAVYQASVRLVDTSAVRLDDVPCWLDAGPPMLYEREAAEVQRAKASLRADPAGRTAGHLVARLPLGFWVHLMTRGYSELRADGPRLWPRGLSLVFPFRWPPGSKKLSPSHADRQMVFDHLRQIRDLRNRVAHHDAIWNRDVVRIHGLMLEMLGWMSRRVAAAAYTCDRFRAVYIRGVRPHRLRAEKLMMGLSARLRGESVCRHV